MPDLREEFLRRWPAWQARLQPALREMETTVRAACPVLLEDHQALLESGHRQVGLADAGKLAIEAGRARAWVAGYQVELAGLEGLRPPLLLQPEGTGIRCRDATGTEREIELEALIQDRQVKADELRGVLPLQPPWLVTATRFPEPESITVYELAHFAGQAEEGYRCAAATLPAQAKAMAEEQAGYLGWFLDLFGGDRDKICVDVGADTGWLAGSLGLAGAGEVLGLDLRHGSQTAFIEAFPASDRSLLAVADMFVWPLGAATVDLIFMRNNSAFVFVDELDARFTEMFRACAESLRPGGGMYLSFLTNCSGVEENNFRNPTIQQLLAALEGSGLRPVKLMRQGGMLGMVLGKEGGLPRIQARIVAQRQLARWEYFAEPDLDSERLDNWLVCLTDVAAEIGLAAVQAGKPHAELRGDPLVVAQVAVVLNDWYQKFCTPICNPEVEIGDALRVDLGTRFRGRSITQADLRPFDHPQASRLAADQALGQRYHSLSADHDRKISRVLAGLMPGRLKALAGPSELAALQAEEQPQRPGLGERFARWRQARRFGGR